MNRLSLFIAFLTLAALGCNSSSTTESNGGGGKASARGTIGVSLLTLQNPFFQVIADNITTEAAKHGYDVIVHSADEDVVKQDKHVQDFIVDEAVAIVLSPCKAKAIGPTIEAANNAGIPLFTVDIPCRLDNVEIVSQIASDNYGGGVQAAEGMIRALGEAGGKVAILHFAQAESCQLRVEGFQDGIKQHNESQVGGQIEIVSIQEGGGAKDRGLKATEDLLQSNPDIVGIFAINDPSVLGALAALEKANKSDQVVLIGFDGQPDAKQAIKEGKVFGDPVQFPDKMGVEVVKAIIAHLKGEEVPAENLIPTEFYDQAAASADPNLP